MLTDPGQPDPRRETRHAIEAAAQTGDALEVVRRARALLGFGKAPDTIFCAAAFVKVADALVEQGHRRLKTYLVRSVTVEPILPFLTVQAVLSGYVLDIKLGGYGSYIEELLNPRSALAQSETDLVIVLLDLEDICGRLPELCADGRGQGIEAEVEASVTRLSQMLDGYRAANRARLVLAGCVVPENTSLGPVGDANLSHSLVNAVRELNRRLAELCRTVADCVFFDIDQAAARFGRAAWRDERMFLASRLPIAAAAFPAFANALMRTASSLSRPSRKVLCTDLDNTFWGGILGEDGPQGIVSGSAFPGNCFLAYQRYLKQLSARGILLAAVSKNNPADVEEAFALRSADLALRLDDFTARKIGWSDKTDALRELAQELSLGLDSFVFVDDNPSECDAVRRLLPEVAVVQAPSAEPWKLVPILADEWFFDSPFITADDTNRVQDYKAQAQRVALLNTTASRDDFLRSLEIVCTFVNATDAPLARSVQLLSKTNQYNLTTRRHSSAVVEEFAATGLAIAVRVRDRFGDAGVVGLALAWQQDEACRIDSLLLSCRVIGRGIESALLASVAEHASKMGAKWLIGEYIETKKNAPCSRFYADHGFEPFDVELGERPGIAGSVFYRLDLTERIPVSPPWLTLEGHHELAASTAVAT